MPVYTAHTEQQVRFNIEVGVPFAFADAVGAADSAGRQTPASTAPQP